MHLEDNALIFGVMVRFILHQTDHTADLDQVLRVKDQAAAEFMLAAEKRFENEEGLEAGQIFQFLIGRCQNLVIEHDIAQT